MIKIITPFNKSDSNIYRVKRTMEVMHYDYSEADPLDIVILPENPMKNFKSGEDLVAILDDKPIKSKLIKCSKCGYWHTENKCPNCGTISGWSDHRHGVDRK